MRIQWDTQKIAGGEFSVRLDGIFGQHAPITWPDWQESFKELMWEPIPGVEYSGVMMPGAWGWSQVVLQPDGVIKAVVAVDRVDGFVAHLNGLVERTDAAVERRQQERVRANEAMREQQRLNVERDEELRRQFAKATGKAT